MDDNYHKKLEPRAEPWRDREPRPLETQSSQNKQPTSFDAYACAIITGVLSSMSHEEIDSLSEKDVRKLTDFAMEMAETCIAVKRERVTEIRRRTG